jgi:methylated-DNA-[protein]-cysteine S-methyltransferase
MRLPVPVLHSARVPSPLGEILVVACSEGVVRVALPGIWSPEAPLAEGHRTEGHQVPAGQGGDETRPYQPPPACLDLACAWIAAYFSGGHPSGDPVPRVPPLSLPQAAIYRAAWAATRQIPPGETLSYGALAARLGRPRAARAVGQAMRANPVPLLVPCHRVVAADGALTGYSGGGIGVKAWLLAWEAGQRTAPCPSR